MSRRRKKCRCCRELFQPHPQTYRQQITCDKAECRAWRKRQAQQRWRLKNVLYDESRQGKQRAWRQSHRGYWKRWRAEHAGYVTRNRLLQKRRNARNRGMIAKQNAWSRVQSEKIGRIRRLRLIAKQNASAESVGILTRQIELICQCLQGRR